MFSSVLVVCVGNICRSPVGERLLARLCPDIQVASAGIHALTGHAADETAARIAAADGLSLDGHVARQFTAELAAPFDLILVMEEGHRREIHRMAPHLVGRTLLMTHWSGKAPVPDPFRKSDEFHRQVFSILKQASHSWASKLGGAAHAKNA
ncbi:MAG TPA: low molecular weight phosphotyrosine protein phosphatase [Aliiroseovarius sp.]|nr:low molecular weight phosphotyrosine protein phosphatase [Aliiroseovarius sp.]